MSPTSIIATLPETERAALALCGVTLDAQLAAISPEKLRADLEQAAQFFPEQIRTLPSQERLGALCALAASRAEAAAAPQEAAPAEDEGVLPEPGTHNLPTFEPARGSRRHRGHSVRNQDAEREEDGTEAPAPVEKEKDDPRSFAHSICCARPLTIYLGAWATLALVAAIITIMGILFQLLIGVKLSQGHIRVAEVVLGVLIVYYYFMRRSTCSTCRINIFSFRRYPRHRQAHHFPLLGCTVSTALSVIFCLRYRCPSCGTPQKLYGCSRRRRWK